MTHIDGTICNNIIRGMPSRVKIAYYWRDSSYEYFDYNMDWGEPSCWACGTFDGTLDIDLTNLTGFGIFKVWENHSYLQRCHIVPKSFGGCNCEANLVLLCHRCHKASPDSRNPIHFINWVKNKKKIFHQEIKDAMTLLEYSPEENDWKLLISDEFKDYYRDNSVLVGGLTPISTYIACFIEFKTRIKNNSAANKRFGSSRGHEN